MNNVMVCTPRQLPLKKSIEAAETAVRINPHNHVPLEHLTRLLDFVPTKERIAVVTKKYSRPSCSAPRGARVV